MKDWQRNSKSSRGTALVILAAGASKRLGQCKALVDLGGLTPLERLVLEGRSISRSAPLIVSGFHHQAIEQGLPAGCELLHNPSWEEGRTGGLALAVQARPDLDLCVAPVDVPLVPRSAFWALQRAWQISGEPPCGWLAPSFEGRFGHPILIGRDLARQVMSLDPGQPLRELRRLAEPLMGLESGSREILDDLDTPADLDQIRTRIPPG
jgi:molybdenum cofactor cytidylyltransferase